MNFSKNCMFLSGHGDACDVVRVKDKLANSRHSHHGSFFFEKFILTIQIKEQSSYLFNVFKPAEKKKKGFVAFTFTILTSMHGMLC